MIKPYVPGTPRYQLNSDHDLAGAPGSTLRELLEEQGLSQAELARRTQLSPKHVNQILQGVAPISADVAQRLELVVGTPARLWLRLEADYQGKLARQRQNESQKEAASWLREMPVKALVDTGYLPDEPADPASRVGQLLRLFAVATVDAYRALVVSGPQVAFRQSHAFTIDSNAVAAWLRIGELEATIGEQPKVAYDANKLRELLPRLRRLTTLSPRDFIPKLRDTSAEAGVIVVFIPEISGARAFGATRWIGDRPVIQLSLRGRTTDRVWKTYFHEVGHVLLHDKRSVYIEPVDDVPEEESGDDRERAADDFAVAVLFGRGTDGLDTVQKTADAVELAARLSIAPGIVVSELQRRRIWDWNQGNSLKHSISESDLREDASVDSRFVHRRHHRLPGSR